ncbi:MAG: hypothetical protein GX135_06450 [Candidatus Cloacimonetes bacterium]|nr:hypothetical protein [Candidatus Cloacimonadota bacterium]
MKKRFIILCFMVLLSMFLYASDWYEASIVSPTPFLGNNGEIFKLSDGSVWEVIYEYRYMYKYYPYVTVSPSQGKLLIDGKKLNVTMLVPGSGSKKPKSNPETPILIESRIDGEFNGFEGDSIFKLVNGQIWQQTEYYYRYRYRYMPSVLIYKSGESYKMQVEGIDRAIRVHRLK